MKSYGVIQVHKGRKYYFITIAELLNITRAAERLMVSQPSLTQYLNHLENELEVKLVDRNFTPLRLTRAGKLYYDYLRDEKAREEQFIAELEELKNESRLPLRIGLPLQKRFEGLSKALLQFCMERPSLNVSVWEGTSATVRERVLKGELDIGFGHYVEEQDDRFIVQTIRKEKIVILCNRDNPIVRGQESRPDRTLRISPEALSGQLFYQMSEEYYLCTVELAHMKQYGVRPKQRIIMSNLHGIADAIVQNPSSGFAYMPDYVLEEAGVKENCDQLAFLRLDEEDYTWSYNMFRKKGKTMTKDARDFWNYVRKTCC
jgi:DNA-binding transcriptional LysR family regulator